MLHTCSKLSTGLNVGRPNRLNSKEEVVPRYPTEENCPSPSTSLSRNLIQVEIVSTTTTNVETKFKLEKLAFTRPDGFSNSILSCEK